jgi:serine/threonine protein kinase
VTPDPPHGPPEPTQTLREGRFVVLAAIGEGSQGRTFDGFDRLEGRAVAIKRFDVRGARSWKDVDLAEREARVLQSLSHPRLPRYVDRFEEGGALYLVMEKIEGESLAVLRARGATLSPDDVLRLLQDAGEVLDYLHGRAPPVIHRDLKPGNVIRRPDGSFAFVDFGAVRDKLRPEGGSTVVGTFGYMAPEQFQGRALPASDVYAMGATALAMLTGRQPEDLPHKGLTVDVRAALAGRGGRGNERLTGILEAMLEPDPDRRASRIAPLLEGARRGRASSPGRTQDRARDRHGRGDVRSDVRDSVEEAMNRYAEQRARREARRRQRYEARQARRRERIRGGFPFPLSLLLGLAFAVGIVAVTVTTQLVVPLVLTILSIFVARGALRRASSTVRDTGRSVLDNMERSRRWLHGDPQPPAGAESDEPHVRVEPGAPDAGGVRVADDEEREEDEESRDAGATRRRGG